MLSRRSFLQASMASAASLACTPALAKIITTSHPRSFVESVRELMFAQSSQDIAPSQLQTIGNWPSDLTGSLYRNGATLFKRGEQLQDHWFDGDGMIHGYKIANGKVTHQARYVKTDKFNKEHAAKQFLYAGAGTKRENLARVTNSDTVNTANTSIQKLGNRYFAMWEAGSAVEIDPDTLQTKGYVTLAPELKHMPFSAHPVQDGNGEWWNFGNVAAFGKPMAIIYHLDTKGQLKRYQMIDMPDSGYMHAFAVTQQYIVLLNTACKYTNRSTLFVENFEFQADNASQFVIVDKADLTVKKVIEIPSNFVFHFGGAYEENGEVVVNVSEYQNSDIMINDMYLNSDLSQGSLRQASYYTQYRLSVTSGQFKKIQSNWDVEFPQLDWQQSYQAQTTYTAGALSRKNLFAHALVSINADLSKAQYYDYGNDTIAEEPLLIRTQSGRKLVSQTFINLKDAMSGINLFEPEAIQNGPIASAINKQLILPGFHGCFSNA